MCACNKQERIHTETVNKDKGLWSPVVIMEPPLTVYFYKSNVMTLKDAGPKVYQNRIQIVDTVYRAYLT